MGPVRGVYHKASTQSVVVGFKRKWSAQCEHCPCDPGANSLSQMEPLPPGKVGSVSGSGRSFEAQLDPLHNNRVTVTMTHS